MFFRILRQDNLVIFSTAGQEKEKEKKSGNLCSNKKKKEKNALHTKLKKTT